MHGIHMIYIEILNEEGCKVIFSHTPDHGDICALSRGSDGLICSLAAGDGEQVASADGFAGLRKSRRTDNEVCIQRTDHKNIVF